jgi:hypothetical protein
MHAKNIKFPTAPTQPTPPCMGPVPLTAASESEASWGFHPGTPGTTSGVLPAAAVGQQQQQQQQQWRQQQHQQERKCLPAQRGVGSMLGAGGIVRCCSSGGSQWAAGQVDVVGRVHTPACRPLHARLLLHQQTPTNNQVATDQGCQKAPAAGVASGAFDTPGSWRIGVCHPSAHVHQQLVCAWRPRWLPAAATGAHIASLENISWQIPPCSTQYTCTCTASATCTQCVPTLQVARLLMQQGVGVVVGGVAAMTHGHHATTQVGAEGACGGGGSPASASC